MSHSPEEPGSELQVPWGDIFSRDYLPTAAEVRGPQRGDRGLRLSVCVAGWGGHGDGELFICT